MKKTVRLSDFLVSVVTALIATLIFWHLLPDKTKEDEMVEPRIEMLYGRIPESTKRPYFAYGTLTRADTMMRWAEDAEFVGVAELYGFTRDGLTRISEDPKGVVTGALWLLSESDEAHLDDYEGVSSGLYEKIEVDGVLIYK